jgi:type IV secretion system protein TrbL
MKYLLGITLLFLSGAALAVPTDGTINQIVGGYNTATSTWEPTIKLYAWRLFWLLVAIDWSWGAMKLATQNSEFDSVLGFLVNRIMVVGFFMALLQFGSSWSIMLIDSFRQLAVAAGGAPNINPSNVMDLGLQIAVELLDKVSLFNPITTTIAGITSIIILIIFALITVELVFG